MNSQKAATYLDTLKNLPKLSKGVVPFLGSYFNDRSKDVIKIPLLNKTFYLVRSPALIQEVLMNSKQLYARHYGELSRILGRGLVTSEGDEWRKQRKILAPFFHTNAIYTAFGIMKEEVSRVGNIWESASDDKNNHVIDIENEMMALILKMITRTLFSSDSSSFEKLFQDAIPYMFQHLVKRIRSPVSLPFHNPLPSSKKYQEFSDEISRQVYALIKNRRDANSKPKENWDVLDVLVNSTDKDTGLPLTEEEVRDQVLTLLIAGHETTAHLLTWTFLLLSRHHDYQNRVYDSLKKEKVDLKSLFENECLESLYQESLRLYPPVWFLERRSKEEHTLGDVIIPKDAPVSICLYLSHRDSRYWSKGQDFLPERFMDENSKEFTQGTFAPFGGGARTCIGQSMAKMQFFSVVTHLLEKFHLDLAPLNKDRSERKLPDVNPLITLRPLNHPKIVLTKRMAVS